MNFAERVTSIHLKIESDTNNIVDINTVNERLDCVYNDSILEIYVQDETSVTSCFSGGK